MEKVYDVIIIGGGPGGYTAALYAARAGLSVLVLEKLFPGGQLALTSQIDNYPGFPEGVDGFTLGQQMKDTAEKFGARTQITEVTGLQAKGRIKQVQTPEGVLFGKTLIFATGASPRVLGLAGEQELTGKGVSYCAHCDGMFYRNKTVVVVGGGNSAVADALILSRICKKVILVHRRDTLRATKVYHAPLKQAENVEFSYHSVITGLEGLERLTGVRVKDLQTGTERLIECEGLFISIGREPATQLLKDQLQLDENGYIPADESTKTEIDGLFAVGDVRAKQLRQVVTAVADGAAAAQQAEEYLVKQEA